MGTAQQQQLQGLAGQVAVAEVLPLILAGQERLDKATQGEMVLIAGITAAVVVVGQVLLVTMQHQLLLAWAVRVFQVQLAVHLLPMQAAAAGRLLTGSGLQAVRVVAVRVVAEVQRFLELQTLAAEAAALDMATILQAQVAQA